jgi:hypothetical protein
VKKFLSAILAIAMIISISACDKASELASSIESGLSEAEKIASSVSDEFETLSITTEATTTTTPATTEPETTTTEATTAAEPDDSIPDGEAIASLIEWMQDGTYSFDFSVEMTEGETEMTADGSVAMDDGKMNMTMKMDIMGYSQNIRVLLADGKGYMIDDVNKTMIVTSSGADLTSGITTDYSGIEKIGEGEGELDGKTLRYEDYTQDDIVSRFYLDGGEVVAIETDASGSKMVMYIENSSNTVPAGTFDIPKDYEVMEL